MSIETAKPSPSRKSQPRANRLRRFVGWIEGRWSSSETVLLPYRENLVSTAGAHRWRHCCPGEQSMEATDDSQATQVWPNRIAKEGRRGLLGNRCRRACRDCCYAV